MLHELLQVPSWESSAVQGAGSSWRRTYCRLYSLSQSLHRALPDLMYIQRSNRIQHARIELQVGAILDGTMSTAQSVVSEGCKHQPSTFSHLVQHVRNELQVTQLSAGRWVRMVCRLPLHTDHCGCAPCALHCCVADGVEHGEGDVAGAGRQCQHSTTAVKGTKQKEESVN
jgi:hypothetical protein